MLTKGDLSSIQKLVKNEVQNSEKRLSSRIEGLDGKIEGLDTKIVEVKKALESKIAKVQESVDIVQEVVVKHYGELDQRVTSIEEELRNPKN